MFGSVLAPGDLSPLSAALLGALQGIAEFLPISSSGHLSLMQQWLEIDAEAAGHRFNITVHAGTLLAVLAYYRHDLIELARTCTERERGKPARALILALVLATLPLSLALTPWFEAWIIAAEQDPRAIGVALLFTALLLLFTHRRSQADNTDSEPAPTPGKAIVIGLFQLVATLPGVSRSGSTIAAALALGHSREQAARFSFLLSIPAILGASLKEGLSILAETSPQTVDIGPFVIGFIVSFVVGLASLKLLIAVLVRVGLLPFVPYLVAIGTAALIWGGG